MVKQIGTQGRNCKLVFALSPYPRMRGEQQLSLLQIAAIITKTLFAEIIGHTFTTNIVPTLMQRFSIARDITQRDAECITCMHTTAQLFIVSCCRKNRAVFQTNRLPIQFTLAEIQTEPLPRHRVLVFETTIANIHLFDAGQFGKLPGNPDSILVTFFNVQTQMLTNTRQFETELL